MIIGTSISKPHQSPEFAVLLRFPKFASEVAENSGELRNREHWCGEIEVPISPGPEMIIGTSISKPHQSPEFAVLLRFPKFASEVAENSGELRNREH
jgi:hypothetical protein